MKRSVSVVALFLLLSGGVTYGQGEVVSYYRDMASSETLELSPDVGGLGFVITDITSTAAASHRIVFLEDTGGGDVTIAAIQLGDFASASTRAMILNSGIAVSPNAKLSIQHQSSLPSEVTVSGYIPGTTGTVPTVGEWGLLVLTLSFLTAGTIIFAKRRAVAA